MQHGDLTDKDIQDMTPDYPVFHLLLRISQ